MNVNEEDRAAYDALVRARGLDVHGALADRFRPTDAGNADRFIAHANGRARFVHAWGKWIVYADGRWIIDANEALVVELAKGVALTMIAKAAQLDVRRDRDALLAHAKRCEQANTIAAMLRLARGAPGVLTDHERLDADPWLLNVTNGTIDLRTGQLRPHNPDDLLTQQAPVSHDHATTPPLLEACLERWQPNPDDRAFLQRAAGSGITGHPVEALIVNTGNGANGKSRFFGAITDVLGPYCVEPHKSLFVAQRHEQHPTALASLFRARLVTAPETSKGDRLDEELVKNLTGGDRLRARRMREDEWSFNPSHTAFLHTNHRPRIRGTDEGIWRRVKLLPWSVTIPPEERDDELQAKLRAERAGILNWLIAGALAWQEHGLAEPDSVRSATAAYREDEDHVARFLADCCTLAKGHVVTSAHLRDAYEKWCSEEGERPLTAHSLGRELTARGCYTDRLSAKSRGWFGIALVDNSADLGITL